MSTSSPLSAAIADQTERALWELKNVIDCMDDNDWNRLYCDMPLWKHIYHTLHSLDCWYINPRDPYYQEPAFHAANLNNLDIVTEKQLTRAELDNYYTAVRVKISAYAAALTDEQLLEKPENCEWTRFTLILAQFRHLHTHMGMLMGFLIDDHGLWPRIVGLEGKIPSRPLTGDDRFC